MSNKQDRSEKETGEQVDCRGEASQPREEAEEMDAGGDADPETSAGERPQTGGRRSLRGRRKKTSVAGRRGAGNKKGGGDHQNAHGRSPPVEDEAFYEILRRAPGVLLPGIRGRGAVEEVAETTNGSSGLLRTISGARVTVVRHVLGQVLHVLKCLFVGEDLLVFHGGGGDFAGGGQRSLEPCNPLFVPCDRVFCPEARYRSLCSGRGDSGRHNPSGGAGGSIPP